MFARLIATTIIFSCQFSWANDFKFSDDEVKAELEFFNKDPQVYRLSLPPKKDDRGNLINSDFIVVDSNEKINFRERNLLAPKELNLVSEPGPRDVDRELMEDGGYIETIQGMDQRSLRQGRINQQLWSDDYWAYYLGGIGFRYADKRFPNAKDWKENYDYISSNPLAIIYRAGESKKINMLSPSEKYDLLYDPEAATMTTLSWNEGQAYFRESGKVESWMGICHGWAPASYLAERPVNAVTVAAFDNQTKVKFYPDDIKGLISMLWANARVPLKSIGGRCQERSPRMDSLGRPVDPNCLDTNPATWHRAIVNRVGLAKRSFIIDSTYDFQVWNQPLIGYKYRYFNPKTRDVTDSLQKAIVPAQDFSRDRYRQYRARGTTSVVGIAMEVTYAVERRPDHKERDGAEADRSHTVLYTYDLELGNNGLIIGGEWYRNLHPDFLWTPTKDAHPLARNDTYLMGAPLWDGRLALPTEWQRHAKDSAESGQPLAKIVDSLVALSRRR